MGITDISTPQARHRIFHHRTTTSPVRSSITTSVEPTVDFHSVNLALENYYL